MKPITMFIQPLCPYCKKALKYIEELKAEYPELKEVEIDVHDELKEAEFADTFDYYYVPTLYVEGEKIHEGGIFKDEMKAILMSVIA